MRRKIILCTLFLVVASPLIAMRVWRRATLPLAAPTTSLSTEVISTLADPQPTTEPAALVKLTMDAVQPAGRPVLMTATVTNIGHHDLSFYTYDPGVYPTPDWFRVTLTGSDGRSHEVHAINGERLANQGGGGSINFGESLEFPLAIDPLPPGRWSVQVAMVRHACDFGFWPDSPSTPPITVAIKEEPAAVQKWDRQLLDAARDGVSFAGGVAAEYHNGYVIDGLLRDLAGDDDQAAFTALCNLFRVDPLPAGIARAMEAAIFKQIHLPPSKQNIRLLVLLMDLANHVPTDGMLDAVISVIHSDASPWKIGDPNNSAIGALGGFPQKRAMDEMNALYQDETQQSHSATQPTNTR